MSFAIWVGLAAVVLAGVLQGLFAVPMKYAPRWNYENIWLIFSLVGMVLLPWMLTVATFPHLGEAYSLTPMPVFVRIAGFGLCWGIGSALAGLGMNLLGIGLGSGAKELVRRRIGQRGIIDFLEGGVIEVDIALPKQRDVFFGSGIGNGNEEILAAEL